jgi:high affinity Mn2+ porin
MRLFISIATVTLCCNIAYAQLLEAPSQPKTEMPQLQLTGFPHSEALVTLDPEFEPAPHPGDNTDRIYDEEQANAFSMSEAPGIAASTESSPASGAQSEGTVSTLSKTEASAEGPAQRYNFHTQYTLTGMGYPSFSAKYSNPAYLYSGTGSSLPTHGQARETQSVDAYFGYLLGADTEFHVDALSWQGFGLNNTFGIDDFPDGEAFKVGVRYPHFSVARFFLRKTINLDGHQGQASVEDDLLTLRGKQDTDRITITLGRFSTKDVFDNNRYSNDPREQFMNWALMANATWDYPADALGFTTGIAIEWNRPKWTLRYGWFQMSKYRNQFTAESLYLTIPTESEAGDGKIFQDWGMVTELEHRHSIGTHPGAVRLLGFDDRANMGSYKAAVALANDPATLAVWGTAANFLASANGITGGIDSTHALRNTWGFGLNMDQEITNNIGAFSRIGWNCGQNESFEFTDTNWTATTGVSIKGEKWKQSDDVVGAAFIASGASAANQAYLAAGGIGILTGDGALNYGPEKNVEIYYDHKISKYFHIAQDYQFVENPAFNRDRGPVLGIFALRLHYEH